MTQADPPCGAQRMQPHPAPARARHPPASSPPAAPAPSPSAARGPVPSADRQRPADRRPRAPPLTSPYAPPRPAASWRGPERLGRGSGRRRAPRASRARAAARASGRAGDAPRETLGRAAFKTRQHLRTSPYISVHLRPRRLSLEDCVLELLRPEEGVRHGVRRAPPPPLPPPPPPRPRPRPRPSPLFTPVVWAEPSHGGPGPGLGRAGPPLPLLA